MILLKERVRTTTLVIEKSRKKSKELIPKVKQRKIRIASKEQQILIVEKNVFDAVVNGIALNNFQFHDKSTYINYIHPNLYFYIYQLRSISVKFSIV